MVRELARLRVEVTHRKSAEIFVVKGLAALPANRDMCVLFQFLWRLLMAMFCSLLLRFSYVDESGVEAEISVAAYFERKYNYKLKYPNLPCLVSFPFFVLFFELVVSGGGFEQNENADGSMPYRSFAAFRS